MALSKILASIQVVYLGTKEDEWQEMLQEKGICLCTADRVDSLLTWSYEMDETLVHISQSYILILEDEDHLQDKALTDWMDEKHQSMDKGFSVLLLSKDTKDVLPLDRPYLLQINADLLYDKILGIWLRQLNQKKGNALYKLPISKRIMDVSLAVMLLILLSPLLILVAILIKLESRGPLFYAASRVGRNYETFPFFKFRSMRVDAEHLVKKLSTHNHYQASGIPSQVRACQESAKTLLLHDQGSISETTQLSQKDAQTQNTYFKLRKDPRVTRVGAIIRKLSIDEIPQLN